MSNQSVLSPPVGCNGNEGESQERRDGGTDRRKEEMERSGA